MIPLPPPSLSEKKKKMKKQSKRTRATDTVARQQRAVVAMAMPPAAAVTAVVGGGGYEAHVQNPLSGAQAATRTTRLAEIRKKFGIQNQNKGEGPSQSSPSLSIELATLGITVPSQDPSHSFDCGRKLADTAHLTEGGKVPSLQSSRSNLLFGVCLASFILICCVSYLVSLDFSKTSITGLDCHRLSLARAFIYFYFASYLCVSVLLRPGVGALTPMRRRSSFFKIGVVAVGILITAIVAIGPPNNVCNAEGTAGGCYCGLCAGTAAPAHSNATSLPEGTAGGSATARASEQLPISIPNLPRSGDVPVVSEFCQVKQTPGQRRKDSRMFLVNDVTLDSVTIDITLRSLIRKVQNEKLRDSLTFRSADSICESLPGTICHGEYYELLQHFFERVALVGVCDRLFKFGDSEGVVRSSCSGTICCNLCKLVEKTRKCSYMASKLQSDVRNLVSESFDDVSKEWSNVGLPSDYFDLAENMHRALQWAGEATMHLLNTSNMTQVTCVQQCNSEHALQASWYGSPPLCLPREQRSWEAPNGNLSESVDARESFTDVERQAAACKCDEKAKVWWQNVTALHICGFLVLWLLAVLQMCMGFFLDGEAPTMPSFSSCDLCSYYCRRRRRRSPCFGLHVFDSCAPAKEHTLRIWSHIVSVVLIVCLSRQVDFVESSSSRGDDCLQPGVSIRRPMSEEEATYNLHLTISSAMLTMMMLLVVSFSLVYPEVSWQLRGHKPQANVASVSANSFRSTGWMCVRTIYYVWDKFQAHFSFENGQYYVYARLFFEAIEVLTQTLQLYFYADQRPYSWIRILSTMLILNGIFIPIPFLLGSLFNSCRKHVKMILTGIDIAFDAAYLFIAVSFSDKESFSNREWWISTGGILYPVLAIALVASDLTDYAHNSALRESARQLVGGHVSERLTARRQSNGAAQSTKSAMGKICFSLAVSAYSVSVAGWFLYLARLGDLQCRTMLGDSLWSGAEPQFVIGTTRRNGSWLYSLHSECNYLAVKRIESVWTTEAAPALVRLPNDLSRLSNLESIVLQQNCRISSDGVPVEILDGITLPKLTRLDFSTESPANRVLNLEASAAKLKRFPPYTMKFMTGLEILRLGGSRIEDFPPKDQFLRLRHLKRLDVSRSNVAYLPPFVLYELPQLIGLNLTGTPVSVSLDWSNHSLGDAAKAGNGEYFDTVWSRLLTTLPYLTRLDLSSNGLVDASTLDIGRLPRLRHLNLSHNPSFTPPLSSGFSWWDFLSNHDSLGGNASFIGLANVGLGPEHFQLWSDVSALTHSGAAIGCAQLKWLRDVLVDGRLDLHDNTKFASFYEWASSSRKYMKCLCVHGPECAFVDEALYSIVMSVASSVKYFVMGKVFQPDLYRYSGMVSMEKLVRAVSKSSVSFTFYFEYSNSDDVLRLVDSRGAVSTILSHFQSLPFFGRLQLNSVEMPGELPATVLESMTKLVSLELSKAKLHGNLTGMRIDKLTRLENLVLEKNLLRGPIPDGITRMTQLTRLRIGVNDFTGNISCFTSLTNLQYLGLGRNKFAGTIPPGIGKLTNLVSLHLEENLLEGPLPAQVMRLTRLTGLKVSNNDISGSFPRGASRLSNLKKLEVRSNKMAGTIPSSILTIQSLNELDMSRNFFSGPIPPELGQALSMEKLELFDNELNGTIPEEICGLKNLEHLDLSSNRLSGGIADCIGDVGNIKKLRLNHNRLSGRIPTSIQRLTNLEIVDLSTNTLNGSVPWRALQRLVSLEEFDLRNNRLKGAFPSDLNVSQSLRKLLLAGNDISGPFPPTLGSMCREGSGPNFGVCGQL